jgi:hypothetical protein
MLQTQDKTLFLAHFEGTGVYSTIKYKENTLLKSAY